MQVVLGHSAAAEDIGSESASNPLLAGAAANGRDNARTPRSVRTYKYGSQAPDERIVT